MTLRGLNHITLAVKNLETSVQFYTKALGLTLDANWASGAYLAVGDLWVCLSLDPTAEPSTDYTHIAFDVDQADFNKMRKQIVAYGVEEWKSNRSEGDSFYFLDPEGHKLELHVGTLRSRLSFMATQNVKDN